MDLTKVAQSVNDYFERSDIAEDARCFAEVAHKDQEYGGQPYYRHLYDVVNVLRRFGINEPYMLAAGYLHDVEEDTDVPPHRIASAFGPVVSTLVWAVTDEPGQNRKERKRKTYPKTRGVVGAVTIKLADRIANVEHAIKTDRDDLVRMYRKEYPEFREALYDAAVRRNRAMWRHLEEITYAEPV